MDILYICIFVCIYSQVYEQDRYMWSWKAKKKKQKREREWLREREGEKQRERQLCLNGSLPASCTKVWPQPPTTFPKIAAAALPKQLNKKWSEEQIEEEIHREAGNPVQTSPLTYRQLFKHCHRMIGHARGIKKMSFLDPVNTLSHRRNAEENPPRVKIKKWITD